MVKLNFFVLAFIISICHLLTCMQLEKIKPCPRGNMVELLEQQADEMSIKQQFKIYSGTLDQILQHIHKLDSECTLDRERCLLTMEHIKALILSVIKGYNDIDIKRKVYLIKKSLNIYERIHALSIRYVWQKSQTINPEDYYKGIDKETEALLEKHILLLGKRPLTLEEYIDKLLKRYPYLQYIPLHYLIDIVKTRQRVVSYYTKTSLESKRFRPLKITWLPQLSIAGYFSRMRALEKNLLNYEKTSLEDQSQSEGNEQECNLQIPQT